MVKGRRRYGNRDDVRLCVIVAVIIATLYAAFVVGLFLFEGPGVFDKNGTSVGAVVVMYYAAGLLGGVVVGILLPLTRSLLGIIAVGVLVALIVFFCVAIGLEGPFWRWGPSVWRQLMVFGVIFGVPVSIGCRKING
ncbi:MAG: hypothetical protein JWM95_4631 [Gemmatimonadetes bacterium]|nr:hypothetical protein [Gemmatimonadota bacterium]